MGSEMCIRDSDKSNNNNNDDDSYLVMDGGLCVLDSISNGRRPSHDLFEGSKDVWVLSNESVIDNSLIRTDNETLQISIIEGELPSRVADNLFWLGRHAEKTEATIRVLSTLLSEYLSDETRTIATNTDDSNAFPISLIVLLKTVIEITGATPGSVNGAGDKSIEKLSREFHEMLAKGCLLYTSPSPRDLSTSRMPSSA